MSAELEGYRNLRARLEAGEPVRILIGANFFSAMECIPGAGWLEGLRSTLIAEADRQIAALSGSEPTDPGPAAAQPVPELAQGAHP